MSQETEQCREPLLAARIALFESELALGLANVPAARVQLDLAQAYITETKRILLTAPAAPAKP